MGDGAGVLNRDRAFDRAYAARSDARSIIAPLVGCHLGASSGAHKLSLAGTFGRVAAIRLSVINTGHTRRA